MKLYATISSDRASKGQGGNEYIDIDLFSDKELHIGRFVFMKDADNPDKYVLVEDDFFRNWDKLRVKIFNKPRLEEVSKGKKQKTAKEYPREGICGWSKCGYPCVYSTDYCERHQTP